MPAVPVASPPLRLGGRRAVIGLFAAEVVFAIAAWTGILINPNVIPVSVQAALPLALPLLVLRVSWRRIGPRMRGGIVPLLWFVVPIASCGMATVLFLNAGISARALPDLHTDAIAVHIVEFRSYSHDLMIGDYAGPCSSYRASILGGLASQRLGNSDCQFGADRSSDLRGSLKVVPGNAHGTFYLYYQPVSRESGETRRGPFRLGLGGWLVRVGD